MLNSINKRFAILLVIFFFILLLLRFTVVNYQSDRETLDLNESLRSTALVWKDDSARITPGTFYLNKESFEEDLREQIITSRSYGNDESNLSVTFDYLEDSRTKGIKGIRVFVHLNGKEQAQATCIVSLPEEGV